MEFIAEIGLCHNGNFDLACEMMRQATEAGADAVKMQLGWRDGPEEMNYISSLTLEHLFKYADFLDTELMFSIFHREAFNLIKDFPVKRYKVASRTVVNGLGLVQDMVDSGKEVIISLGMWKQPEVPIEAPNVRYLWCKTKYPTMPWEMLDFPKDFSDSIYSGYSDHTLGIDTALMAVSRGAKIIEKHFTLDKSDTTIRDHVLAATPSEFAEMVRLGRAISKKVSIGV